MKTTIALLSLLSIAPLCLADTIGPVLTLTVEPDDLKGSWDGWGNGTGKEETAPEYVKDALAVVEVEPGVERTFAGRVEGRLPKETLEIGIVSLVGIHWIKKENYEWSPLGEDGTFNVSSKVELNARKAICVRGPEAPWTFYPYDFAAHENGEGIVITLPERKKVTITAGEHEGEFLPKIAFERFTPGSAFSLDGSGQELRRQQYGRYTSDPEGKIEIVFPAAPVALFLGAPDHAKSYKIIDPRTADHFHFILKKAGRMEITVLNPDGTPAKDHRVNWVNDKAPLSLYTKKTDDKGIALGKDLTAGIFSVSAEGTDSREVEVKAEETLPVVFQLK